MATVLPGPLLLAWGRYSEGIRSLVYGTTHEYTTGVGVGVLKGLGSNRPPLSQLAGGCVAHHLFSDVCVMLPMTLEWVQQKTL